MSRDSSGGVQMTHQAVSEYPKDWVEFAQAHDIDTLWLDGSPGTWCNDLEPDEVLLSLRPSWTETLALSNRVDRKRPYWLSIAQSPHWMLTIGALLSLRLRKSWDLTHPSYHYNLRSFEQRTDDLRSKQLRLAYDGTSIQRIVTHLVDSEALARYGPQLMRRYRGSSTTQMVPMRSSRDWRRCTPSRRCSQP